MNNKNFIKKIGKRKKKNEKNERMLKLKKLLNLTSVTERKSDRKRELIYFFSLAFIFFRWTFLV